MGWASLFKASRINLSMNLACLSQSRLAFTKLGLDEFWNPRSPHINPWKQSILVKYYENMYTKKRDNYVIIGPIFFGLSSVESCTCLLVCSPQKRTCEEHQRSCLRSPLRRCRQLHLHQVHPAGRTGNGTRCKLRSNIADVGGGVCDYFLMISLNRFDLVTS